MKKIIFAVIVGIVVQLGGLFLIHAVWLKQDYIETAGLWRTPQAATARGWAILLGTAIYVLGVVLIYVRGREAKPWIGQGVRFGILLAMVATVYASLSGWVILPFPHQLVLKWIIGESSLAVLLGVVIAGICREAQPGTTKLQPRG
jgi:archaellum biogenesis protein FlaJ (TadC family)